MFLRTQVNGSTNAFQRHLTTTMAVPMFTLEGESLLFPGFSWRIAAHISDGKSVMFAYRTDHVIYMLMLLSVL